MIANFKGVEEKDRRRRQWVTAVRHKGEDEAEEKAHRKLTGLGIASGSILCLGFCTAGMSDACFTFKCLSSKLCKTSKYKE